MHLPLAPAALVVFVFAALPFVALGQRLARSMDEHPRLIAYGWDIAGSIGGTTVFSVASWLGVPPWIWPPVLALAWAVLFGGSRFHRIAIAASGLLFLVFSHSPQEWRWSPYYFVQFDRDKDGLQVWVNSSFHQYAVDFTNQESKSRHEIGLAKWGRPYEVYRKQHGVFPRKVLILGAGTGNDVHVAKKFDAEEIVAVEIDPVILELGVEANLSRPYADPRVRTYVDDARHFLRTSNEKFDLIVMATLDSQALFSGHANLRLENYVYTHESLTDAKELLTDGGMLAVYYSVSRSWLYARLYTTVRSAFGDHSTIHFYRDNSLFNTLLIGAVGIDSFRDTEKNVQNYGSGLVSTDDWPFVYLERPTIAPVYVTLFVVISILLVGVFVMLRSLHPVRGLHANFFFLGLGFTLMESSAIVRLALVFGSTWIVNAVVFASVLVMIFIANTLVLRDKAPSLRFSWIGLVAAIGVNYGIEVGVLFELDFAMRVVASGLLIGTPVFFASVCFSRLFASQPVTGYPLGLNLIGAMGGGLIEYVSMLIGMRSVWLVVLGVYLMAWFATAMADRGGRIPAQLAPAPE